jgi:hypothetical protein
MCSVWAAMGAAQELSPRSFWPAPRGTKIAVFGYSRSSGDVLMDPSLPIYGGESKINTGFLAYMQTFSLLGRTSNFVVELPYSWGTSKGFLLEYPLQGDFSGFNDLGVTLAVNLFGAPSMNPSEFVELRAKPRQMLGASVKVVFPAGYYDANRLINVGANRWATKAEVGYLAPLTDRWILEFEGGAWFFSDDDDFLPGKRKQNPIFSAEVHLIRRFKPGFWASAEANFFVGGDQTIGGNQLIDLQRNSRIGGTVMVPFLDRYSLKVGYSTNIVTDFGTDFDQFLVSYQVVFR